ACGRQAAHTRQSARSLYLTGSSSHHIALRAREWTNGPAEPLTILSGSIVLHLPLQVYEEWERNRDTRLSFAIKEFKNATFVANIPHHMLSLQMAETYQKAVKQAKEARDHLVAEATAKARLNQLDVDKWLFQIFSYATKYQHDDAIFARGKLRAERGNPPGKPGSFGDQYNWEMLLAKLPDDDLYIVSNDGDFASALGKEKGIVYPNILLKREWSENKGGNALYVFDTIADVLNHYDKTLAKPAAAETRDDEMAASAKQTSEASAELSVEKDSQLEAYYGAPLYHSKGVDLTEEEQLEKEAAIDELGKSQSFATTHALVKRLKHYHDAFTTSEVNALFAAALGNEQVNWILKDADVNKFYLTVLATHVGDPDLDVALLDQMIDLLGLGPAADDSKQPENDPGKPSLDDFF
ncbi:PIN domain-containing protein, partial [Paraburkholderia sp. EG286B]|uniref:PIN domain-containing protein n=1 Tax=Paraburkholderia sp. EG286B TaxID=3237011 RepID=UPI0034D29676